MSEKALEFKSERDFHKLYCETPENLKAIEKSLDVNLVARGNLLKMSGGEKSLNQCEELFKLLELGREQGMIAKKSDFRRFLDKVSKGRGKELSDLLNDPLVLKIRKNLLSPETWGSEDFLISYSDTTWFLGLDLPGQENLSCYDCSFAFTS